MLGDLPKLEGTPSIMTVVESLAVLSLKKLAVETRARCGRRRTSPPRRSGAEGTNLTIASRGVRTSRTPGESINNIQPGLGAATPVADSGSTKSSCPSCGAVSSDALGRRTTSVTTAATASDATAARQVHTITRCLDRSDACGSNTNGASTPSCAARSSENAAASTEASSRTASSPNSPPVATEADAGPRDRIASTAFVNCSGRFPGVISFPLHAARLRTASHEAARRPCAGCS